MTRKLLDRISEEKLAECFGYLDVLRQSGATNMFGARPHLIEDCELDRNLALDVLQTWMNTPLEGTPQERVARLARDEDVLT